MEKYEEKPWEDITEKIPQKAVGELIQFWKIWQVEDDYESIQSKKELFRGRRMRWEKMCNEIEFDSDKYKFNYEIRFDRLFRQEK